jgi:hypothetical protein
MKGLFLLTVLLLLLTGQLWAQDSTTIAGTVINKEGQPVPGASVYLANTLDGTSTDASGKFTLTTRESGERTLMISAIGFTAQQKAVTLNDQPVQLNFILEDVASQLDEVVISAGAMEANSDREVAILKPMDIYNNAGAAGDIVGAIQTLPGTQRVAEQTGLFVRGGDASESAVIIDGMVVQNAFFSNVPGVAQRSRFTPFQFKGMAFSSGGYGARYGQALSSILELNTLDLPDKSNVNANINMAGVALSAAKRWQNSGAEVTAYYNDLSPFYNLANTNFDFYDVPSGGGASVKWSAQNKSGGIFKAFVKHDTYQSGTEIPDPYNAGEKIRFGLKNKNTFANSSFRQLKGKTLLFSALSFSHNKDDTQWGTFPMLSSDHRLQWRGEGTYFFTDHFNLTLGSEIQAYAFSQDVDTLNTEFKETITAAYTEAEWKPARQFTLKAGFRFEYSKLIDEYNMAPRVAFAVKTGDFSQVSLAGGVFYQLADKRYLLGGYKPGFQQAAHYIANYQWINDSRSFRIEGYYKSYDQLVRELNTPYNPNPYRFVSAAIDNSGSGSAQGVDLFWRDQKSVSNFDYWIAYSFVDTKRLYANLTEKATPDFVSNHNININTKYFIESLQLNIGLTYSYASGRPYYDPAADNFLGSRTPDYHNLSMNLAYLTSLGKWFAVFYAGFDNVLNRKNILGYRYSADGQARSAIEPPLYRSVFVGANISLTAFKKEEL